MNEKSKTTWLLRIDRSRPVRMLVPARVLHLNLVHDRAAAGK